MNTTLLRGLGAVILAFSLAACGGGGGGGGEGGGGSLPTEPTDPPDEVPGAMGAPDLSDRTVNGEFEMVFVVIDDGSITSGDVTFEASTGVVSGTLLGGTDLDGVVYTNPANGEFSRIARISGDNVFGAVGLEASDLPTAGTVTNYNEGWVGMTAIFEDNVFVLTGDSEFTVTWGNSDIDGRFFNLSGTSDIDGNVTNVGTIILTNGNVAGDDFAGGTFTGTGIFDALGGSGTSRTLDGAFFGPQADELGGVFDINDTVDDIQVSGAFQAD